MEQSLVLTFDVGTQSARCLLVNESGDFEDKEQQKYKVPYLSKQPGWAEQTPDFYFNIIAEMSKKVIERNADKLDRHNSPLALPAYVTRCFALTKTNVRFAT